MTWANRTELSQENTIASIELYRESGEVSRKGRDCAADLTQTLILYVQLKCLRIGRFQKLKKTRIMMPLACIAVVVWCFQRHVFRSRRVKKILPIVKTTSESRTWRDKYVPGLSDTPNSYIGRQLVTFSSKQCSSRIFDVDVLGNFNAWSVL